MARKSKTYPEIADQRFVSASYKDRKAQEWQNELDRQFQLEMYERQRADALADYEMQNLYNSPQQQMERYRQAGLSPHLIYGSGASSAAASIRSAQPDGGNQQAPKTGKPGYNVLEIIDGLVSTVKDFYEVGKTQAETANIKETRLLLELEQQLKSQDVESGYLRVERERATQDDVIKGIKLGVKKQEADLQFTLDENQRRKLAATQDLEKGVEEILLIKANRAQTEADRIKTLQEIELLKKEQIIKDFEARMAKKGVTRNDKIYWRELGKILEKFGIEW